MKAKIGLLLAGACISASLLAQDKTVAQFVAWKPKEGQEQSFENGYKQHLNWHKTNGDTWSWYGWFVVSGPRDGQFIDATFNHAWSDFDQPVNPAGDRADNASHVYPFGDVQSVIKVSQVKEAGFGDADVLQSKYLRMITLRVTDMGMALQLLKKWGTAYREKMNGKNLLVYQLVDGGNINQLILLLGFRSWEEYGNAAGIQEQLNAIEKAGNNSIIRAISSETLVYRPDMSLLSGAN